MFPVLPGRPRSIATDRRALRLETEGILGQPMVLPIPAARPGAPAPRVLIVALDSLTDVVLSSAITPLLRSRYPDAEITLWCACAAAPIGALVPGVDRVEGTDPFWEIAPGRIGPLIPFVRSLLRLRKHAFDVAVLGNAHWRAALAVAATRASRRVGRLAEGGGRWLTDVVAPNAAMPLLNDVARLLDPLDVRAPAWIRYWLNVEPLAPRRERFRPLLGPRPVALQPFAGKRMRGVPLKRWIRVAVELSRRGYDPIWIGRASELREVRRAVGADGWKYADSFGGGGIADAAAVISLAHLYIGHDSGPLHLARALGVPTIGIYTEGEPAGGIPEGTAESRAIVRRAPEEVTSDQMLAAFDALPHGPFLRLVN